MANKYIRHGETYCGDGTTSAAAASNGGVGAWNNINILENTAPAYGALAAGDTVFVRTEDAAGADITVTKAAATSLGNSSASELLPITWVFDAGTVWSGISGIVTYNMTAALGWTCRAYNNLMATNHNLIIKNSNTSVGHREWVKLDNCSTNSVTFDVSASITGNGPYLNVIGGLHVDPIIKHGSITFGVIYQDTNTRQTTLINPTITVAGGLVFAANETCIFITDSGYSGRLTVYGGSISGASLSGVLVAGIGGQSAVFESYGFVIPSNMVFSNATKYGAKNVSVANGCDGGLGNVVYDYWCEYSSRADGFYPTLNATLESSAGTEWSYRLHTYRTTPQNPAQISLSKMWTQAAAAKTVTVEILWPTTMTAPTVSNTWITVSYVDNATGLQVLQTTRLFDSAALTASTNPDWSALTYGATLFDRYKLAITTSGSIKQDTPVNINLFVTPRAVSAAPLDIIMVCPDPVFS